MEDLQQDIISMLFTSRQVQISPLLFSDDSGLFSLSEKQRLLLLIFLLPSLSRMLPIFGRKQDITKLNVFLFTKLSITQPMAAEPIKLQTK